MFVKRQSQTLTVWYLLLLVYTCEGLVCYECTNARNDEECRQKGRVVVCSESQESCQTTERVAFHSGPKKISKTCKQARACHNNHKQNNQIIKIKNVVIRSEPQCNYFQHLSVCRCCCVENLCNYDTDTCTGVNNEKLLKEGNRTPRCPRLRGLKNGILACDNGRKAGSSCRFQCLDLYDMHGPSVIYCQQNKMRARWTDKKPCCAKPCPPHGNMDLVLGVDSSVQTEEEWNNMIKMVKKVVRLFVVGESESRIGVVTFNEKVGKDSEIYLSSHNATSTLLAAVDALPYQGVSGGTRTGQVLNHVSEVSLSAAHGNRRKVRDLFVLLSAGSPMKEKGRPDVAAKLMRDNGIQVIVVGVGDQVDYKQLHDTAGSSDSIIEIRGGAKTATDSIFRDEMVKILCGDTCVDK